jgi:hypothetical protein
MSTNILESAETFIWNNARLLERRLFSFLFKGGLGKDVITALSAYQNEDGGFGNALEPDKRTSTSQPIEQEVALRILDDMGFDGKIAGKICEFLMSIRQRMEVYPLSCHRSELPPEQSGGIQMTTLPPPSTLRRVLLGSCIGTSSSMVGLRRRPSIPGEKSKSHRMEVHTIYLSPLSFLKMH